MRFATMADKDEVEAICNNPLVRLWTSFSGKPCDATRYLTEPNKTILFEHGCFLGVNLGDGRYDVHLNLLPNCRGQQAIEVTKAAVDMAFEQLNAQELIGQIPVSIPQSAWIAKKIGMKYRYTIDNMWPAGGVLHDVRVHSIQRGDWEQEHCHA